jgi:hypothetical protein
VNFKKAETISIDKINVLKKRIKGNAPPIDVSAFTGTYENELYGTITITATKNDLLIKFNSHANLTASLQYMDKEEWLMSYNNIAFGIFATKFKTENNKVVSVEIKANDFVEYDPYTFIKK